MFDLVPFCLLTSFAFWCYEYYENINFSNYFQCFFEFLIPLSLPYFKRSSTPHPHPTPKFARNTNIKNEKTNMAVHLDTSPQYTYFVSHNLQCCPTCSKWYNGIAVTDRQTLSFQFLHHSHTKYIMNHRTLSVPAGYLYLSLPGT